MDLPRTRAVLQQGIDQGLHLGGQLYVSLAGQIVADFAFGQASPGQSMRTDHLLLWMSAGKPITALAIAQLWEWNLLDLDDPVARHIPAFADRGKQNITIRHLLTHTSAFRGLASNWSNDSFAGIIQRLCQAPMEGSAIPGRYAAYSVAANWYILGELVRVLDGRPLEQFVRDEILLPAGMPDSWVGMDTPAYREYGQRIAIMYDTSKSGPRPQNWHSEAHCTNCRPGANARGPIRELGRFYEMLLNRGKLPQATIEHKTQIASRQTIEAMIARHRTGLLDHTFKHVIDWGLGFIINSAMYGPQTVPYGFGPYASRRTFGHGGAQSTAAFADPEHQLVVAFAFNGMPGEQHHDQRLRAVCAAIYEDLNLNHAPQQQHTQTPP